MSKTSKTKDYQALNQELDKVLEKLQQPSVRVDEAVVLYEQGLQLIDLLEIQLQQAENKIEQLKLNVTKGTEE